MAHVMDPLEYIRFEDWMEAKHPDLYGDWDTYDDDDYFTPSLDAWVKKMHPEVIEEWRQVRDKEE